jgi:hypothetical protein
MAIAFRKRVFQQPNASLQLRLKAGAQRTL